MWRLVDPRVRYYAYILLSFAVFAVLMSNVAYAASFGVGGGPIGEPSSGGGGNAPCSVFGTGAGQCAQGNDSRIVNSLQPSTAAGGDISGTMSSLTVNKILGSTPAAVSTSGLASDLSPALDAAFSAIAHTYTTQGAIPSAASLCALKGSTLILSGNTHKTLTFPAAGTCGARAQWEIINGDRYTGACSGRGDYIAVTGAPSDQSRELWPGQTLTVTDTNGGGYYAAWPTRWKTPQPNLVNVGCVVPITAITWAAGVATATVSTNTAQLQTNDPVTISGAAGFVGANAYNITGVKITLNPSNTTQFTYPLVSDPGGSATSANVTDTKGFFDLYVSNNGTDSAAQDGLAPDVDAFKTMNYCMTTVAIAQFDAGFNGGATFLRCIGERNYLSTESIHNSSTGALSAGGASYILKGQPGFFLMGDLNGVNNTIEANLNGWLRIEDIGVAATASRSCIAPHQGGKVQLAGTITFGNSTAGCPAGDIVADQEVLFQITSNTTLVFDCTAGDSTAFFNVHHNSSIEQAGTNVTFKVPHACNPTYVILGNYDSGLDLNNATWDLGGTVFTPTAISWVNTGGACGGGTVSVPSACAVFADTTGMTTGDPIQSMGSWAAGAAGPIGYNLYSATGMVVIDGTHISWPVATNPSGSATTMGVVVDKPDGPVTGVTWNLSNGSSLSANSSNIPGAGKTVTTNAVGPFDTTYEADRHTFSAQQIFSGGSTPIQIGANAGGAIALPLNAAAGVARSIQYQSAGVSVWKEGITDATANWRLDRLVAGVFQDTPISVANATGLVVFADNIGLTGSTAHAIPITEAGAGLASTGAGTAGQLLTSNGSSVDPSFQVWPTSGTWAGRPGSPTSGNFYLATDLGPTGCLLKYTTFWSPASGACVLYQSGAATNTTSTTETNLASYTVPAGLAQASSSFSLHFIGIATGANGVKTLTGRFAAGSSTIITGGNQVYQLASIAANLSSEFDRTVYMKNATNSEVFAAPGATGAVWVSASATAGSVDTASAWTFSFNGSTANGGDTLGYSAISVIWRD